MSEAEAMGHFLHDIMNPDPQPGPPCAHTFSPGTDEELAAAIPPWPSMGGGPI